MEPAPGRRTGPRGRADVRGARRARPRLRTRGHAALVDPPLGAEDPLAGARFLARIRLPIAVAAALSFCAAATASAQGSPDSARWTFETGVGADFSDFVFFEQSFDSTAFSERTKVSDPETRVGALFAVQGRGARGRVRWRVADELRAGNTLLRNLATAGGEYATGATSAVSVDLEADLRRDTSFDLRRSDARLGGVAAGRLFAADRSASVRAFGRVERVRDGEDGEPLFPDFDWWQAGVDADRHGRAGSLALNYAYGERAFPDTAARDYREHDAGLTVFLRAGPRLGLDAWGGVARRLAWDEAAVGDRLWQGDVEGRATWRAGEATELGVRARLRFATYDAPTPTFFDGRFWRWAAFVRFPGALTVELRPEVEFARTPDFGGLPPEATDDDRRAVAGEEFDEIALHADLERFAAGAWWTLAPAVGKRDYLDAATDALDLSARSDFWYVELFGFAEKRFPGWTLRATGDVRWEEHAIATDDARSLSVAAELRVPLR